MDNTQLSPPTSTTTDTPAQAPSAAGAPVLPFPTASASNTAPAQAISGDAGDAGDAGDKSAANTSAAKFLDRVVQGAHQAIDGLAAKASSKVDAVGQGASKITDTRDAWVGAARDAIRERPFAAMGVALLIGAAYISLRSSRRV